MRLSPGPLVGLGGRLGGGVGLPLRGGRRV
ncbi:hypothetical protein PMI01_04513, partial [Caulobacter sp. AP07]